MKILLLFLAAALFPSGRAFCSGSIEHRQRLHEATLVLRELVMKPDKAIPQHILDRSECIVVIPGMKKGAFFVGARYGKGYLSCRQKSNAAWSAPGTVRIEGGSVGLQIGGSESDIVMLIMNRPGVERLLGNQFTIGGAAAAGAGPVDRSVKTMTDASRTAEILSWSRTRGVFAGVSLQGATLRQDLDENFFLYGKMLDNRQIIEGNPPVPAIAKEFIATLTRCSSRK
jgi:lipid-binding SYLF domain-containing protein